MTRVLDHKTEVVLITKPYGLLDMLWGHDDSRII